VQYSARYVVLFAIAVCAVCSVFVSSAAVFLKERQEANEALDLQTKVLGVAGLMSQGEDIDDAEVRRRFDKSIETHIVDLSTGNLADEIDPQEFDQHKAAKDPEHISLAPPNAAKVISVRNDAKIFSLVVTRPGVRLPDITSSCVKDSLRSKWKPKKFTFQPAWQV